jgi:hypothetical protein
MQVRCRQHNYLLVPLAVLVDVAQGLLAHQLQAFEVKRLIPLHNLE